MIKTPDFSGDVEIASALVASVVAEAAGLFNDSTTPADKLVLMYRHGLRFTPFCLTENVANNNDERYDEVDFFRGSCLTKDQVELELTNRLKTPIAFSASAIRPVYASYVGGQLLPGKLFLGEELLDKAKNNLSRPYKAYDKHYSFNGLLAERVLKVLTTSSEAINVRRLSPVNDLISTQA